MTLPSLGGCFACQSPDLSHWDLWEINPDKYFFNGKLDVALAQLKKYVDNMEKADYSVVQTGSGISFPSPGTPVPDEYTPRAYARCLQVVAW